MIKVCPFRGQQVIFAKTEGFWALSAMSAAETNFDLPLNGHSWLALAQAVFNEQTSRWDVTTCGGGMRWQAYSFLAGWALKNSISNGVYFQLGARLARFTGNDTYAQLAARTFDWMETVGLVDKQYNVYDNSQADGLNCSQVDHNQWSYNAGTMLIGAAYMYNYVSHDSDLLLVMTDSPFFLPKYSSNHIRYVADRHRRQTDRSSGTTVRRLFSIAPPQSCSRQE